jgi:hypothetical protein
MVTWAFIFKSDGCSAKKHNTVLEHCGNKLLIYGVDTIEEGAEVAKRIVAEDNCRLIELCGGFGEEGARVVREAVENKILVGYITYFPEDAPKLAEFQ